MKILIMLVILLSIAGVSIIAMIYGWGLKPENWGWICFGYLWAIIAPLIIKVVDEY